MEKPSFKLRVLRDLTRVTSPPLPPSYRLVVSESDAVSSLSQSNDENKESYRTEVVGVHEAVDEGVEADAHHYLAVGS